MTRSWLAFVPYTIALDILDHPDSSPVGREQRSTAVAMFADVSGFTAISEALAQAGRAGTEELTRILNDYFETMIALVRAYGGIVGQFGGDALTVLFPFDDQTRGAVVRRAVQCALEMQAAMDRFASLKTQVGTFQLSFKAGLAAGICYCTTVGDLDVGYKSVVAGGAMDLCADAEKVAARGEVVIHHNLLPDLGAVEAEQKAEDFSRVIRLPESVPQQALPTLDRVLTEDTQRTLVAYVHPVIAERLTRGQRGFVNEHRGVTVLFVHFGGFDYDHDPDVGAKLQPYLSAVLRVVQQYDGYLNKVDMGDKGSKVIVLFGAPVAHEDDEERALRCALEMRAIPGVTMRIGVNTGSAFCGLIGAPERQEYTVMGDAVNLSARLMQAAQPGQILVSQDTQRRAARFFDWQQLAPVTVKGKTEPVQVYAAEHVRGRSIMTTQELDYGLPMVGRAEELATAETAIDRALAGAGQIIGITAEAGMGKSRLSAEIIRLATAEGLTGYGGECESYGTTTSYLVWQHIWQTFFGIDPAWPLDRTTATLEQQLNTIDPALVGRLPLLGPALNVALPDNAMTAGLGAKVRKSSLEALLVACLRARAATEPVLLVLEDVHWIDPLSFDLLTVLARNIAGIPVLLLLVYRPPELAHIDLSDIRRAAHFTELALAEFTPEEAAELIRLKLRRLFVDLDAPPPALVAQITARAQGNPFYIDEMVNLLQDEGVDLNDPEALENVELPDTLHSLVISRIDRLVEDQQIALKVASVIGRLFRADWLWEVYPDIGDPQRVQQQLDALRGREFVLPSGVVEPEFEYLFKHIVTREVAYESLAVATRTRLHEQFAAYLEKTYPDDLDRFLDVLAYHYSRTSNTAKQREYYRRAGEAAQRAFANDAAIDYYERLIPLLEPSESPAVQTQLGEVLQLTGKLDEAADVYSKAIRVAHDHGDVPRRARARNKLGHLYTIQGRYEEALATLDTAFAEAENLRDQELAGRVLGNIGSLYLYQGEAAKAVEYYERALAAAQAAGDQTLAGIILGNWGYAHVMLGEKARGLELLNQQVDLRMMLGDRHGTAIARLNIGVAYEDMGDYARALENYQHCLNEAAAVGDQMLIGLAVGNIGLLYALQGDQARALACLRVWLALALELGDQRLTCAALVATADALKQQGDLAAAGHVYEAAVGLSRSANRYELCSALYGHADLLVRQGDYAAAQPLNTEAHTVAEELNRQDVALNAAVQTIRIRLGLGALDTAAAVEALVTLEMPESGNAQRAALHYARWQLDASRADDRQQAAALYRDLYTRTPNAEYAARYHALTGDTLPAAPDLPPLPDLVAQRTGVLDALLARVAALIPASKD